MSNYVVEAFKKMNQLCSNFLISQLGESTDIKNFIKENQAFLNNNELVEKIDERIFYESYFSSAIININNSFKNIIKRKYNGFIYNILFNDQINEFVIKDINNKDMKFYLINSNDQNISIIIYEFKKDETLDDIKKDDKTSIGASCPWTRPWTRPQEDASSHSKFLKINKISFIEIFLI